MTIANRPSTNQGASRYRQMQENQSSQPHKAWRPPVCTNATRQPQQTKQLNKYLICLTWKEDEGAPEGVASCLQRSNRHDRDAQLTRTHSARIRWYHPRHNCWEEDPLQETLNLPLEEARTSPPQSVTRPETQSAIARYDKNEGEPPVGGNQAPPPRAVWAHTKTQSTHWR